MVVCLFFFKNIAYAQTPDSVDILIVNAQVFDGLNTPAQRVVVGVKGDRITFIGESYQGVADKTIDADNAVLAPGFIDPHTHADKWLKDPARNAVMPWVKQGVTTLLGGNDGFGPYNIKAAFDEIVQNGMGLNLGLFVGFGTVRSKVLGKEDVQPSAGEIEKMKELVDKGMKEGAIGFSTGLLYVPQRYSKTEEIIELSKIAAQHRGIYDTHMRSESGNIINSIKEVLEINEKAGLPVHISHLKVAGRKNWGRSDEVISLIREARKKGVDITASQYPFNASMTSLKSNLIPGWAQAGGNAKMVERLDNEKDLIRIKNHLKKRTDLANKNVMISTRDETFELLNGKTLYDICQEWDLPIEETVVKILKMNPAISAISFSMSEEDIVNIMKEEWVMTDSDGGGVHPRTFSTFSKIIEKYALQEKLFDIQYAIYRGTGLTAKTFGITDRGVLKVGNYADLIVFHPQEIEAKSTFKDIVQLSEGMKYVIINGKIVVENGTHTGTLSGRPVLRK